MKGLQIASPRNIKSVAMTTVMPYIDKKKSQTAIKSIGPHIKFNLDM